MARHVLNIFLPVISCKNVIIYNHLFPKVFYFYIPKHCPSNINVNYTVYYHFYNILTENVNHTPQQNFQLSFKRNIKNRTLTKQNIWVIWRHMYSGCSGNNSMNGELCCCRHCWGCSPGCWGSSRWYNGTRSLMADHITSSGPICFHPKFWTAALRNRSSNEAASMFQLMALSG